MNVQAPDLFDTPDLPAPEAFSGCARRELTEETGLSLAPEASLRFIFRAITPQGSPRRFDARFLLADPGSPTMVRDTSDEGALYVLMPMRV